MLTRVLSHWADASLERKVTRLEAKVIRLAADLSTLNARREQAERRAAYWKRLLDRERAKAIERNLDHAEH